MRKFIRWLSGGIILCTLLYIALIVGIYHKRSDVDVNSGRLRQRTCLWFICLHEEINETLISQYSAKFGVQPDWRKVSFLPIRPGWFPHSKSFVDFVYGGVPVQIENLRAVWGMHSYSEEQKRESAGMLLKKWRENDSDRAGGRYVFDISEAAGQKTIDSNRLKAEQGGKNPP